MIAVMLMLNFEDDGREWIEVSVPNSRAHSLDEFADRNQANTLQLFDIQHVFNLLKQFVENEFVILVYVPNL